MDKKGNNAVLWGILLAVIILMFFVIIVAMVSKNNTANYQNVQRQVASENQDIERNTAKENQIPEKRDDVYRLNEKIDVDYLTYTIIKAESFDEMGSTYMKKETDGKFIKVYVEIVNNAKETKDIFTPRLKILDDKDRVFERLSDDIFYIDDYLEFGKQLQPGLKTKGAVVFEMPEDADNLILLISGDFFSSTEVKVKLSSIKEIGKDTTLKEANEKAYEEIQNSCDPFVCKSSCKEDYIELGRKDCPSGKVCCME